jgi:glyoxylase-like metal-dependent hydrolase (beta-lactamase superfamily II)
MQQISENLFLFHDTCNVYVIRDGSNAVIVEFGSGDVLEHLRAIGVSRVLAVLMTHHHRDVVQGLVRAVEAGIPIYVPHFERDLFANVDKHWQARSIDDNYDVRQDRFSLLNPVPIAGTLEDYTWQTVGDQRFEVIPTPGHTTGSITLISTIDGKRIAFSGDLIAEPGKVWSMAATQWSYNGLEGVAASILSLRNLAERPLEMLLPTHREPMYEPRTAMELLIDRMTQLLRLRRVPMHDEMLNHHQHPYRQITPHLLHHWLSVANTFVLLSERGTALMFDFGYDMFTGFPSGTDVSSRRPLAYSLPTLKRDFNITAIDVVIPTHYHDDHVAGFNVLRRLESAQVWAAESFADILVDPKRYDLPCLWYEPTTVDRRLPLETPITWEEYTLTLYALPGHTRYAVAIALEVDGKRVMITGDQYQDNETPDPNYVYANRFEADDFVRSAALYRRLNPDLILTGHWLPKWTTPEYFDQLDAVSAATAQLHRALLVDGVPNDDVYARILPYQSTVTPGSTLRLQIEITNPHDHPVEAHVRVIVPDGIAMLPDDQASKGIRISPLETAAVTTTVVIASDFHTYRARIAVDLILDGRRLGQQAEALISSG